MGRGPRFGARIVMLYGARRQTNTEVEAIIDAALRGDLRQDEAKRLALLGPEMMGRQFSGRAT